MRSALAATAAAVVLGSSGLAGPAAASTPAPVLPASGPLVMDGFEDYDWWYEAMRIEAAHRQGATGKGVTVALIDSPLDLRARELQGQDVELRTNCRGARYEPLSPEVYEQDDEADHGTSMASLIVGSGRGNAPGGVGVAGVAPEARLLAYSITIGSTMCSARETASQIDRAVEDGADIISMSNSWPDDVEPAVRRALDAGVVVVASMSTVEGAGEWANHPAVVPGVVAVQAVTRSADPWEKTRPSKRAVIAAPGAEIGSGLYNPATGEFDSRGYSNGTSAATAIVSGVLAAVKSKYPDATGHQLVQHLIHRTGGEKEFDWNASYGFGIASVTEMLKSSPTQWPDENPLLDGPRGALRDYPSWVSSEVEDPPGKGENAPEADTAADTGTDEDTDEGTAASEPTSAGGDAAGEDRARDDGLPGWVWPVGGAVGLLAAAAIVVARRRGETAA